MGRYCHYTYWCKIVEFNHYKFSRLLFAKYSKFGCTLFASISLVLAAILFRSTIMSATDTNFPMPSASADLITTWAFLQEGVDHIMTKLQTGVSYSKVI